MEKIIGYYQKTINSNDVVTVAYTDGSIDFICGPNVPQHIQKEGIADLASKGYNICNMLMRKDASTINTLSKDVSYKYNPIRNSILEKSWCCTKEYLEKKAMDGLIGTMTNKYPGWLGVKAQPSKEEFDSAVANMFSGDSRKEQLAKGNWDQTQIDQKLKELAAPIGAPMGSKDPWSVSEEELAYWRNIKINDPEGGCEGF